MSHKWQERESRSITVDVDDLWYITCTKKSAAGYRDSGVTSRSTMSLSAINYWPSCYWHVFKTKQNFSLSYRARLRCQFDLFRWNHEGFAEEAGFQALEGVGVTPKQRRGDVVGDDEAREDWVSSHEIGDVALARHHRHGYTGCVPHAVPIPLGSKRKRMQKFVRG